MKDKTRPEKKIITENMENRIRAEKTFIGEWEIDAETYPYFETMYELPFIHIGVEKQLFLDNYIVEEFVDTKRIIQKPEKAILPLLEWTGLPWEQVQFTGVVSAALQDPDDGIFKMWYLVSQNGDPVDRKDLLCYAESVDGLNWEKPLTRDFLPYKGYNETNIVLKDVAQSTVVLNNDQSEPEKKYLMIYNPCQEAKRKAQGKISRTLASPDGKSWNIVNEDTPYKFQHQPRVIWDNSIEKWVAYSQYSHEWNIDHRRKIGRQESTDFINWSPKEAIMDAAYDPNVDPDIEFHDMSVRKEGGLYIGIMAEAKGEHFWYNNKENANIKDQFHTKMFLCVSRNGRQFTRINISEPWVDNGEPGSQDYGYSCNSSAGVLVHDAKMIIPYSAFANKQRAICNTKRFRERRNVPEYSAKKSDRHVEEITRYGIGYPHFSLQSQFARKSRSIGGLILREDGWAKLKPVYEIGKVYTRQFVFEGDMLMVNADCNYGFIKVEILDANLNPYPGFSLEECNPIHGQKEKIWHEVRWKDNKNIISLWNKPVRICFHLVESSLYAFRFIYTK